MSSCADALTLSLDQTTYGCEPYASELFISDECELESFSIPKTKSLQVKELLKAFPRTSECKKSLSKEKIDIVSSKETFCLFIQKTVQKTQVVFNAVIEIVEKSLFSRLPKLKSTETLFQLSSKSTSFAHVAPKPFLQKMKQLVQEIHTSIRSQEVCKPNEKQSSSKEIRASFASTCKDEIHIPKTFSSQERKEEKDKEERQRQHHEENLEESSKGEKKKKINGIEGSMASSFLSSTSFSTNESSQSFEKPSLTPPQPGIFSVYYLLDKLGIASEANSYKEAKEDLELTQVERESAHKQMVEAMKKSIEKEKQTTRWSVAASVFSWTTSLGMIFAGVSMVMTGVGAIGGAMLIAGGIVALGNQLMEITHGWQKIAEILPGNDDEKKRMVVTWMQIGIAVFSLILSGAGVIFGGGFSVYHQASSLGTSLVACFVGMGAGVCEIGKGVETYYFKHSVADSRLWQVRLDAIRFKHSDLMEIIDGTPDRLLQYFESFARILGFVKEINRAHQRAWR